MITKYAFINLNVHQVYANITESNARSIQLFEKAGFEKTGIKKDWILSEGKYKNELMYQLIKNKR